MRRPKVGTLSDLVKQRFRLRIECERHECLRSTPVDVAAVVKARGDQQLQSFMEAARCGSCGAGWPIIDCRLSPEQLPGC